jgi:hypothetical protein
VTKAEKRAVIAEYRDVLHLVLMLHDEVSRLEAGNEREVRSELMKVRGIVLRLLSSVDRSWVGVA